MTETWREYEHRVRQQPYNKMISVPKTVEMPPHYTKTLLSWDKGEDVAYREDRAADSIHVREFPDKYLVEVDRFNPHHHPVRHAAFDAPKEFGAITAGLIGLGVVAWKARKLFFAS